MRRPLIGLALVLALALVACPGNPGPGGNNPPPSGSDATWDVSAWDAASWK